MTNPSSFFERIEGKSTVYLHNGEFIGVSINKGLYYEVIDNQGKRKNMNDRGEVDTYLSSLCI